ncbi:MAG: YihA family ribosome biogenesis GTP-binding protein, partial [Bacillota bacterium]|nr:YihA family ribosome biogenesis GTP-binding protein [Bacillota bacterium]
YAKVSKKEREAWGKMIETYITTREQLKAVVLIVDLRHPPTVDDTMMYDFLKHYEIPCVVIATKADKIPKGKWQKHLKITKETLDLDKNDQIILFSSETGEGKDQAWSVLESYM